MTARTDSPSEAIRQERIRGFRLAAALLVGLAWTDFLSDRPAIWPLLARGLWASSLLVQARLLKRTGEVGFRRTLFTAGLSAPLFAGALALATGGMHSTFFPLLFTVPLGVVALTQDDGRAVLAASITTAVGIAALVAQAGAGWEVMLSWWGYCLLAGLLGFYSTRAFKRLRQDERNAAEQLAVSERRRSESERLAMVGRLAAGLAHEVFNPLAFIKANLDFLQRSPVPPAPEEQQAIYGEMAVGVERIQQIISDLRAYARSDSEVREVFDLLDVLENALRLAHSRLKGVAKVVKRYGDHRPLVMANRHQISTVFLNLLINAGEAMEGKVPTAEAEITLSLEEVGDRVRLRIEDNGPGLPPGPPARVFEPFFTTKPPGKGTGLGLSVAHEYVQRFGGTLSAENRPLRGARFTVDLPVGPPPPPEP